MYTPIMYCEVCSVALEKRVNWFGRIEQCGDCRAAALKAYNAEHHRKRKPSAYPRITHGPSMDVIPMSPRIAAMMTAEVRRAMAKPPVITRITLPTSDSPNG